MDDTREYIQYEMRESEPNQTINRKRREKNQPNETSYKKPITIKPNKINSLNTRKIIPSSHSNQQLPLLTHSILDKSFVIRQIVEANDILNPLIEQI